MAGIARQGHPPWQYRRRRRYLGRFSGWAHRSGPTETMIGSGRAASFRLSPGHRHVSSVASSDVAEGNEAPLAFVPEDERNAMEALEQRQPADATKFWIFAQHIGQPVERYPAAQMVHVVHADIGREPTQDAGQIVV